MTNRFAHLDARLRQVEGLHGEHTFVLHFPDGASMSKDVRRPLELFLATCELTALCLSEPGFPDLNEQHFQCLTEKRLRLIQLMGAAAAIETDDHFFEVIFAHARHACELATQRSPAR